MVQISDETPARCLFCPLRHNKSSHLPSSSSTSSNLLHTDLSGIAEFSNHAKHACHKRLNPTNTVRVVLDVFKSNEMGTLHLCSSFRQRWQFAWPWRGGEHQRGFLHCGSDPASRSQTSVFWRGGLSGGERRRSASSVVLRGAEDVGGDLHSQTAQQLSQVLQRKSSQMMRWRRRPKFSSLTVVIWSSGLNYSSGGRSLFSPVSPVSWLVSGITTAWSSPSRISRCLRCHISPRYTYLQRHNSGW